MKYSVFIQLDFVLLVVFTMVIPIVAYSFMMWKKAISRRTVLAFGVGLLILSGTAIFLLQRLAVLAKLSPALYDDWIFTSEVSVALYLLPAVLGGIGINMISHILISHVLDAERKYDRDHKLK
jgi:hypothetical protein